MRQVNTYAVAASLMLTITAISYAQDRQPELTGHAVQPSPEIAAVTSDYFDANWALFDDSASSQVSTDEEMVDRAYNYLDANWRITKESSTSAKARGRSHTDYFDANWSVFGHK